MLWIDADAVIRKPSIQLERLLPDMEKYDFIVGDDRPWQPINSGVMLVRNCAAAKEMFARAYTKDDARLDQPAITEAMTEVPALRVKIIDRRIFNAFENEWRPGMFVQHYPGPGKPDTI